MGRCFRSCMRTLRLIALSSTIRIDFGVVTAEPDALWVGCAGVDAAISCGSGTCSDGEKERVSSGGGTRRPETGSVVAVSSNRSRGLSPCSLRWISAVSECSLASSSACTAGSSFGFGPSAPKPSRAACQSKRALTRDLANLRGPTLHKCLSLRMNRNKEGVNGILTAAATPHIPSARRYRSSSWSNAPRPGLDR